MREANEGSRAGSRLAFGRRARAGVAAGIVLAAIMFVSLTGVSEATTFYLTVDEYLARAAELGDEPVKVKGTVVPGTIRWDPVRVEVSFELEEKGQVVRVVHRGVKPDTLLDGIEAVAGGRLAADGHFTATSLMVKCPSKYEPREAETV